MRMVSVYIITIFISYVLSDAAEKAAVYDEDKHKKYKNIYVYLLIVFFIIILGFRYLNYLYSDEWIYRMASIDSKINVFQMEGISALLEWLSKKVFINMGGAFAYGQFYILISSVIVSILYILAMWDYSYDFRFSVFLFVSMWFGFTSMNIVRQMVAAAILFYGMRHIVNKEFWKYFITVMIAAGFHTSAVIMIPLYFFFKKKDVSKWMYVLNIAAIVLVGRIAAIGNLIFSNTRYSGYFGDTAANYGVNGLRLLAYIIPIAMILWKRKMIIYSDVSYTCSVNMMVIALVVMIISSQNVYYNRISVYFTSACLTIFPEIPYLFTENSRKIVKFMMVLLFFILGLYQASIAAAYHNILFENVSNIMLR
jgi:transmembrane protein EpsG